MRTHKVSQDVEDSDSDWRCREFKPQWGSDQPWSLELSNDFACDGTKKTACPPLRVTGTIVLVHMAVPAKLRSNLDINIYIHIYMYMCTYIGFGFVDKLESEKIRSFVGMFWHIRPLTGVISQAVSGRIFESNIIPKISMILISKERCTLANNKMRPSIDWDTDDCRCQTNPTALSSWVVSSFMVGRCSNPGLKNWKICALQFVGGYFDCAVVWIYLTLIGWKDSCRWSCFVIESWKSWKIV